MLDKYSNLHFLLKLYPEYCYQNQNGGVIKAGSELQTNKFFSFLHRFQWSYEEEIHLLKKALFSDLQSVNKIKHDLEELLIDNDYLNVYAILAYDILDDMIQGYALPEIALSLANLDSLFWARVWFEKLYYDFFRESKGFRQDIILTLDKNGELIDKYKPEGFDECLEK